MELKPMFVLKTGTAVDGEEPVLPYQFAATEKLNPGPEEPNFQCIVNIVMPLGGSQSALFRYPREGEKILVGVQGTQSYLMGYMPENPGDNIYTGPVKEAENEEDNEMTHTDILPEEMAGQFFRYKGPEDSHWETRDEKDTYSELGFYHQATQWKPIEASKDSDPFPEITTMNINSSGDIHQDAKNHHRTRAKRYELLVDCEGPKDYAKETEDYTAEDFAFGDLKGDDPQLYAGDAHIRAKNRVIIKAGDEIQLEVGRSAIIITDTGINIVSRKTQSRDSNAWDTRMSLCAKDGIGMFGQWLNFNAGQGFDLSEGYGGSVKSRLGVTRIEGLDVRLATIDTKNYAQLGASNSSDYAANCVSKKGEGKGSLAKKSSVGGGVIAGQTSNSLKEFKDWGDTARSLLNLLDVLLISHAGVGMNLEKFLPKEEHDSLYKALACSEHDLVNKCVTALALSCPQGAIFESIIHLHRNSKIELNAKTIQYYNIDTFRAEASVAGASKKTIGSMVDGSSSDFSDKVYNIASQEKKNEELRSL